MKDKCFVIADSTHCIDIIIAVCTSVESTKKHLYNYCNYYFEDAKKYLAKDEIEKEECRLATIVEYFDKYFEGIEDAISTGRGAFCEGIGIEIHNLD